ncbi:cobyrinic acid a,c-diamide synthase [Halosegnis longus]|uniref:Cobyrinate a,c-diamide synthase n=1 Tax=Halosegnis longus TaxID=2216012 RepID=A0AAJ4R880_9EURY|nr:cobyrinic acid a,c-diamide synthase [Halosegnis longus]RNJ26052.1 cobyrinic acid a,c-diamide synthase [Salella cibi]
MRGIVLGGTSSGTGKTVATLAVLRALQRAGKTVQPAKAGPDFIDPSHHAAVADKPSRTLDPWLQGADGLRRTYARGTGDVCVVEGMMGLYDGDVASTADVAATLGLPVVLVVDASAGMESVGATALGFREYDDRIDVAGVIAQRAHGGRHAEGIRAALPDGITYLGRVPPDDRLAIPDRHLGLELGSESPVPTEVLDDAASHLDTERLLNVCREPEPPERPTGSRGADAVDARVAMATGPSFAFRYPATVERLRERATLVTFDPRHDPLPDCDGVYLPGGYPELYAEALSASEALGTLADRAAEGLPVFGECGGLLALGESLRVDGETHAMAGQLPIDAEMHDRYQALDHVELDARRDSPVASAGETLRGHEFHYSSARPASDARFAFDVARGDGIDGKDGVTEHATLGTYCHVHAESGAFDSFLESVAGE